MTKIPGSNDPDARWPSWMHAYGPVCTHVYTPVCTHVHMSMQLSMHHAIVHGQVYAHVFTLPHISVCTCSYTFFSFNDCAEI